VAAKNWRLVAPDATPNHFETPNVLVYGAVDGEVLERVGRVADEQVTKLRKFFKSDAERPFVRGRMTLYVFDKRYDYGEVGAMLERREIPATWRGHWYYSPADVYGCLLLGTEKQVPPGLVAQVLAGGYVASRGKPPHWFAEGVARAIAARTEPKDPRVKLWDDQALRLVATTNPPDAFLSGKLPPEDADVLSYAFAKSLMNPPARFTGLLAALEAGAGFEKAFEKAYGATPAQMATQWAQRPPKRGR
jgi:hypothetical protein